MQRRRRGSSASLAGASLPKGFRAATKCHGVPISTERAAMPPIGLLQRRVNRFTFWMCINKAPQL